MKAVRFAFAIAVVFSSVALSAPPTFFKVKIKGVQYESLSPFEQMTVTPFGNANLIAACTQLPGAQLVAQVTSIDDIPGLLLTVDPCGNILCTNLVITSHCLQDAATSNGTSENSTIAARVHYAAPDNSLIGDGFMLSRGAGDPQSTIINGYGTKGTFTFCRPTEAVINGTIIINGLFKPAKDCP